MYQDQESIWGTYIPRTEPSSMTEVPPNHFVHMSSGAEAGVPIMLQDWKDQNAPGWIIPQSSGVPGVAGVKVSSKQLPNGVMPAPVEPKDPLQQHPSQFMYVGLPGTQNSTFEYAAAPHTFQTVLGKDGITYLVPKTNPAAIPAASGGVPPPGGQYPVSSPYVPMFVMVQNGGRDGTPAFAVSPSPNKMVSRQPSGEQMVYNQGSQSPNHRKFSPSRQGMGKNNSEPVGPYFSGGGVASVASSASSQFQHSAPMHPSSSETFSSTAARSGDQMYQKMNNTMSSNNNNNNISSAPMNHQLRNNTASTGQGKPYSGPQGWVYRGGAWVALDLSV